MKIHSDHPTFDDQLFRVNSVKRKAIQIVSCDAPQTFGIHGDWGAGKTSYLRQLRYHLDGTKLGCAGEPSSVLAGGKYQSKVITIWFDAWRFQHESAPVIALIQEMRRQFSALDKVKNELSKITNVTLRSILNSIDDIAKLLKIEAVPLNPKRIQEIGEAWEKEHLENRLGVDTVQVFLQEAIKTILNNLVPDAGEEGRVVVFIDDLDRCNADAAFRLLEGLKVYLGLSNCVFILGMNQQLIVDAIANAMPKELAPQDGLLKQAAIHVRAEAYLEKLCMNIERLMPPLDTRTLLSALISDKNLYGVVRSALSYENGLPIRCLPPNPRRIKALSNLILEWWPSVEKKESNKKKAMQALIIISYIYQFHSELFQRWQFTPTFYTHLTNWAVKVWPSSETKKWPGYFSGLKLPEETQMGPGDEPVPRMISTSTYPDPYSPDMFWIAPLMREATLSEIEMEQFMSEICMQFPSSESAQ